MNIEEKLQTITINMSKIFDYGKSEGKKDEYDKFWDGLQKNGTRVNYVYGFYMWDDASFYPKYDIKPTGQLSSAFYGTNIVDFEERLKECNVVFDTSMVTTMGSMFQANYSLVTAPTLDLSSCTTLQNVFYNCTKLKNLTLTNLKNSCAFKTPLNNCSKLENLEINGTIGQDGFNVQWSTQLTKASLLSILKALSLDITATTTITFSTAHQSVIETDPDCKPYWQAAKDAGWSIVYA